ncbi:hypothetical protein B0G77_6371 [Paraburkholderia sp. BL10I2N1]|nr:hypothetical protein B0G77_6371 [Paraburkholderia sp. BL10I2N1]
MQSVVECLFLPLPERTGEEVEATRDHVFRASTCAPKTQNTRLQRHLPKTLTIRRRTFYARKQLMRVHINDGNAQGKLALLHLRVVDPRERERYSMSSSSGVQYPFSRSAFRRDAGNGQNIKRGSAAANPAARPVLA